MSTLRRWTLEEDGRLRALASTHTLEQIGLLLGRTTPAVRRRRTQLYCRKRRPSDLTPLTVAQAKLVAAHTGWADRGARKHAHKWRRFVTEDDLRSAAYMGLIMAARKFDPARGLSFKTLAFTYCESLMRREVDTLRRLDGCAFDARVEGGMRVIAQRTDWPTFEDGTPRDIASVPPCVELAEAAADRARLAAQIASHKDRPLVAMVLEGYSSDAIAATLRRSKRSVMARINNLTRQLRDVPTDGRAA